MVTNRTHATKGAEIKRNWFLIDASNKVLGRLATHTANILRGKHKTQYTAHLDTGDFVVVVNAGKVKLTGNKLSQKIYHRHTPYLGGHKMTSAEQMMVNSPEEIIRLAVQGMLPKGPLGRSMIDKLKICKDGSHPYAAQKPQDITAKVVA